METVLNVLTTVLFVKTRKSVTDATMATTGKLLTLIGMKEPIRLPATVTSAVTSAVTTVPAVYS